MRTKVEVTMILDPVLVAGKRAALERNLSALPGMTDLAVLASGGWITLIVPSSRTPDITAYCVEMFQAVERIISLT